MEKKVHDPEAVARIAKKCTRDETKGCLICKLAPSRRYGQICYKGNTYSAHRLSYIAHKGPVPDGLNVCHRCDNPACVEISHLFLGTPSANAWDCYKKGRHARPKAAYNCKINEGIAAEIKRRIALGQCGGQIRSDLAALGVTQGIVKSIRRNETWRHVEPAKEPLSDL